MSIKERTREELENRVKKLEGIIARRGVGSNYLHRVERLQRGVNIALILGATTAIVGLTAWVVLRSREN